MQTAIYVPEAETWFGASVAAINLELQRHNYSEVHLGTILQCLYATPGRGNVNLLPAAIRPCVVYNQQVRIVQQRQSCDGTVKWSIVFPDGIFAETVLIPESGRYTLCVSSQAGCALGCSFCATGRLGLQRNLSCREIIEQLQLANNYLGKQGAKVTNVVFMGMGEPLHNLDAVVDACEILCHDHAFGLSRYKVTISTVGLVSGIYQLIGRTKVALALSLHAADDEIRRKLLPIARKHSIAQTLTAVKHYLNSLDYGRQVFIEYILIAGCNDSAEQAHNLARLLKDFPCKINLIPCNPVSGSFMIMPDTQNGDKFFSILRSYGHRVMIRQTRGKDIDAACGQLTLASAQQQHTAFADNTEPSDSVSLRRQ